MSTALRMKSALGSLSEVSLSVVRRFFPHGSPATAWRSLVRLLSRCLPARNREPFDASFEERGARIRENIKRHLENTKYRAPQSNSPDSGHPTRIGNSALVTGQYPLVTVSLRHKPLSVFLFSLLITAHLLLAAVSSAQTGSATLSGVIQDPKGAIVPDTEVTITRIETGAVATTKTNGAGVYYFTALSPGHYHLMIQRPGFKQIAIKDIELHTQDKLEQNFSLEIGSVSESVTVNAEATNESPAVSMTVTREFVEDMPLNGRSFQDLIQLAPGTVSAQNGYYSINGQRTDSNNFTVDGVSANLGGLLHSTSADSGLSGDTPAQTAIGTTQSLASIDALEEFKIQTSGYTAEYGRNPGGQVAFTTRSGTNDIHGTLFEYLRNTAFDANSAFNDYYGVAKQPERQNDFGGTVGGPLVIPKLYNGKDKTYYFFSYEGLRLFQPNTEFEYVPTQAFRNWASASVQPFLDATPLPNSAGGQDGCMIQDPATGLPTACDALFVHGYSSPSSVDNVNIRVDQNLGERLRLFLRYADTPSSVVQGAESVTTESINTHSWTAGLTVSISPTLLDELRFNYSYDGESGISSQKPFGGSVPLPRSLVIPAENDTPTAGGNVGIYIPGTNLSVSSFYSGGETQQHQYQIVDSLAWNQRSHALKFGIDWRRLSPTYAYNTYQSQITLQSLVAIQQGYADTVQVSASQPGAPVFVNLSVYAQDHWSISPRLSIDYGLRWEFNPPPGASNGNYPVVLDSNNLATAQLAPLGTAPYKTSYDHFAPRFGFAWNAIPSQRRALTLRGGFGLFYATGQNVIGNAYENAYPFTVTGATQSNIPLPLASSSLAPPPFDLALTPPYPSLNLTSINLTLPYTLQWNLSLDEELGARNTLTVSYVGNVGRKLLFSNDYYPTPEGNPNFDSGVVLTSNISQSNYNALQVQDRGRIASGLDVVASFTWAHALDNSSVDYLNQPPTWGNSDNDIRRALNLALNYSSAGLGSSRWIRGLTHGWVVANRFSAQSAYPIDINQTYGLLPNGSLEEFRPDLVRGVPIYLHGSAADVNGQPVLGNWRLNQAAFALVPTDPTTGLPVRQGTLGRNYIRNPGFWALNTAVERSFPIYEHLHLIFRCEAFNVFNHPNLSNPNTYLPSSTFGQLSGGLTTIGTANNLYAMGAARSLQFSLKLQF